MAGRLHERELGATGCCGCNGTAPLTSSESPPPPYPAAGGIGLAYRTGM